MANSEQNNNQNYPNQRGGNGEGHEPKGVGGFDDSMQRRVFRGNLNKEIQTIISQIGHEGPSPQKPKKGEFDFPV